MTRTRAGLARARSFVLLAAELAISDDANTLESLVNGAPGLVWAGLAPSAHACSRAHTRTYTVCVRVTHTHRHTNTNAQNPRPCTRLTAQAHVHTHADIKRVIELDLRPTVAPYAPYVNLTALLPPFSPGIELRWQKKARHAAWAQRAAARPHYRTSLP